MKTHELDQKVQISLVAKIRHAAQRYKSEPAESSPAALQAYVSALECLAQHIESQCDTPAGAAAIPIPAPRERVRPVRAAGKTPGSTRVIPFPGGSPITAA